MPLLLTASPPLDGKTHGGGIADLGVDRLVDVIAIEGADVILGIRVRADDGISRLLDQKRTFRRVGRGADSLGSRAISHDIVFQVDARYQRLIVGHPHHEGLAIVRGLEVEGRLPIVGKVPLRWIRSQELFEGTDMLGEFLAVIIPVYLLNFLDRYVRTEATYDS